MKFERIPANEIEAENIAYKDKILEQWLAGRLAKKPGYRWAARQRMRRRFMAKSIVRENTVGGV